MNEDQYLIKLKNAGLSNRHIAHRLRLTEEEVARRWERIAKDALANEARGYLALCDQFTVLAKQYELVGESLKLIAQGIGEVMNEEEIRSLISQDPEETLHNLLTRAIMLRPYHPPPPTIPPNHN